MTVRRFFGGVLTLVVSLCAQGSNQVFDDRILTLQEVIASTLLHHPRVQVALSELEEASGDRLAADGAFDWQIEQDSLARTSGFYNGWILDQRVSRRLPFANAKVSGGYRISDGSWPSYQDNNSTLRGGEASLEMTVSLLRDRVIDRRRNAVANTELELDVAQQEQRVLINGLVLEASIVYLNWLRSYQEVKIAEELLTLATDRQEGIKIGVAEGELAQLSITEFETTLLSRQARLMSSQQKLAQTSIKLSLFLRDSSGMPIRIPDTVSAKAPDVQKLFNLPSPKALRDAIGQHPELLSLKRSIAQSKNTISLKENALLPTLDFKVNVSNDIGGGSTTLDGFESYVGLNFSVPLERRVAKGELKAEKAKLNNQRAKYRELEDKLVAQTEEILIALDNLTDILAVRENQARVAAKLVLQEKARFEAGDSDLFLLNTREATSAIAQLSAIDAGISILRQQLLVLANAAILEQGYVISSSSSTLQ